MQPIATIGINIDHFHVLRSFAVILYQKKGEIRAFFQNSLEIQNIML